MFINKIINAVNKKREDFENRAAIGD